MGRDPSHAEAGQGIAACDENRRTRRGAPLIGATSWRAATLHTAAIIAGVLVFAVVFTYTGDADLLFAIGGGLGTGLLIYLTAHIFRDGPGPE